MILISIDDVHAISMFAHTRLPVRPPVSLNLVDKSRRRMG